jgi:hypothetical protein
VGFYIRKSISAGPFRFNLSKSGVGLSVGVRGLRIGTGPRGHYIHAGRGGLYYRSSIGRAGQKLQQPMSSIPSQPEWRPENPYTPEVEMVEIESADVLQMADSRFQTVLEDLNARAGQFRLGWVGIGLGLLLCAMSGFSVTALIIALLAVGGCAYVDSYRRASVLFYDVEGGVHDAYLQLVGAFETLRGCAGKWHVDAKGAVRDLNTWKRNAGAAHLVRKSSTSLDFKLPGVLKSNITPPAAAVGKQWLYFLPDVVLFESGGRFGAISYDDLTIMHQFSRFIEEGSVPGDARVVDTTWRFVNKKGGPDRRFNNNRQIPICLYETMHLTSSSGLNELLEFSKRDVAAPFERAVRELATAITSAARLEKATA